MARLVSRIVGMGHLHANPSYIELRENEMGIRGLSLLFKSHSCLSASSIPSSCTRLTRIKFLDDTVLMQAKISNH